MYTRVFKENNPAFKQRQIKSATHNLGAYNPRRKDIREDVKNPCNLRLNESLVLNNTLFKESNYLKYQGNSRFKFLNKLLFKNRIPSTYKVKRASLPSSFILGETLPESQVILLQKNKLPNEVLDLILIHEMIHAFLYERDGKDHLTNPHGSPFLKEIKRIKSISNYDIPIKNSISSIERVLDGLL